MSTITLKDVPAPVHRALKARARAQGRSLNREIISTLASSLHAATIHAAPIEKHAQAVRETLSVYMTEKDLTELKGAGRR